MKLELNKFKLKQVLLSAFVLLISFGAAATATFAWFTVNRNADLGNSNITIDESVENYKLMYYSGNYTTDDDGITKYTGYQDYAEISTCTYSSDFIEMSESASELWNITDIFPDTRYTYAFELTISSSSQISRAGLSITKYTSTNYTATLVEEDVLTMYKVDKDTDEVLGGIYLSEAINIYSGAMLKEDNATMNTSALNFLNGYELSDRDTSLTDVFNESGDGSNFDGVDLSYVSGTSLSGKTIVVFFTIEFSNASDTYYTYSRRSGNDIYYYKDKENGSSNCYQLLSFSVTALSLFAS
ncbi:MAG: hypothetical protein ACI311_03920 [Bacilli bacterium]